MVVRTSTTAILLSRGPAAIAWAAPDDPVVVFRLAVDQFSMGGGRSTDSSYRRVAVAARDAPLAEEPFFFAGVRAMQAGNRTGAIRLLEEARRRNPRMRLARLMLIDQYLREGRVREAATEITVLSRLFNEMGALLVDQLSLLAVDPRTRPALQRALGNDPLLDEVLEQLVQRGVAPPLIMDLAQPRAHAYSAANPPRWQLDLVQAQIGTGRYQEAYSLWRQFNGVRSAPNTIYNPGFDRLPGSPPFNWQLTADANGVAERSRDGSLEVVYFGRADTELARQLLLLAPGRYRLEFQAATIGDSAGSRLIWRIACADGNRQLVSIPLERLTTTPRRLRVEFQVPPSACTAQWIKLVGESAEFPARREIRLERLTLARAA